MGDIKDKVNNIKKRQSLDRLYLDIRRTFGIICMFKKQTEPICKVFINANTGYIPIVHKDGTVSTNIGKMILM